MYIFHIVLTLNVDEYIGSKNFSIELQVNDGDIFSEKKRGGDRLCIDCNWSYAKCFLRFTENVQWVNLSFVKTSKFTLLVCFVLFFYFTRKDWKYREHTTSRINDCESLFPKMFQCGFCHVWTYDKSWEAARKWQCQVFFFLVEYTIIEIYDTLLTVCQER